MLTVLEYDMTGGSAWIGAAGRRRAIPEVLVQELTLTDGAGKAVQNPMLIPQLVELGGNNLDHELIREEVPACDDLFGLPAYFRPAASSVSNPSNCERTLRTSE